MRKPDDSYFKKNKKKSLHARLNNALSYKKSTKKIKANRKSV